MKKEAADLIIDAVRFAAIAGVNASECGVTFSTSLHLNIRDAMFHYKAMCDSVEKDEKNFLRHYFNLKEHLIRGEKDVIISQAQTVSEAVFNIMQRKEFSNSFDLNAMKELQFCEHQIRDIILRIRIDGSNLISDQFSIDELWSEVVSYTEKITKICEEKGILLF